MEAHQSILFFLEERVKTLYKRKISLRLKSDDDDKTNGDNTPSQSHRPLAAIAIAHLSLSKLFFVLLIWQCKSTLMLQRGAV